MCLCEKCGNLDFRFYGYGGNGGFHGGKGGFCTMQANPAIFKSYKP